MCVWDSINEGMTTSFNVYFYVLEVSRFAHGWISTCTSQSAKINHFSGVLTVIPRVHFKSHWWLHGIFSDQCTLMTIYWSYVGRL